MENEREQKEINWFLEAKHMLLAYWPLFVVFLSITLSVSYVYLRYATPSFQASAKILVKDDTKTGLGQKSSLINQLDLFGSKTNVENEMEVIRSVPVLREAAKKSKAYVKVYDKGNIRDVLKNNFPIQFIPIVPDSLKAGQVQFSMEGNKLNGKIVF